MASSVLCIDIGNSAVKAARFSPRGRLLSFWRMESPRELVGLEGEFIAYIDTRLDSEWREVLSAQGAVELTMACGVPFSSDYTPRLGPDRAAQLIAVWEAKRWPALVLSLGTACTLDYMDEKGRHRGGIITTGIDLRLRALAAHTGRLPKVQPTPNPPLLGKDTPEAMLAGAIHGLGLELKGWIELLKSPNTTIWITGGEAELIRTALPSDAIFAPELTLRGVWLWQRFLRRSGGSSPTIP
ncbi:MAG: type III pantothenate kinase [Bacteroidia bacterium]|nr:type III pantothenate kinase [Bacteroidia bacterium]